LSNGEMDINLYADMYNNLYVTYYANKGDKSTITLFDDNGKLVIQEHIVANDDGMNSHQINAVGLSFGIYFVNIIGENFNESKKVLLKK